MTRRRRGTAAAGQDAVKPASQEAERIVAALERELGVRNEPDRSRLVDAISKAGCRALDRGLSWDLRQAWPGRPEQDITKRYERETA